ncbi:SDR family oxidoreductase [Streptomyces rubiginosohelvolus]|uniref:SDR family oxidoreductase n=1 Tax=Streptomyces rubiginosohelvolus TaxID=67362 RepID=UPI0036D89755
MYAADSLSGLRVAVTGATGGIGRVLVAALQERGAAVAVTGSDKQRLDSLTREVPGAFGRVADITDEEQVADFMRAAVAELGGLDVLVNLAGLSIPGEIAKASAADFGTMLDVNVSGTMLACKHAIPHLAGGQGLIVNVGSAAGLRPNATAPGYCTAKAAVAMFTAALSLQLKEERIRVTHLAPGGADTPFWGDRPVQRESLMAPEDVVSALLYVMSLPPHVVVRELLFESTGAPRSR